MQLFYSCMVRTCVERHFVSKLSDPSWHYSLYKGTLKGISVERHRMIYTVTGILGRMYNSDIVYHWVYYDHYKTL